MFGPHAEDNEFMQAGYGWFSSQCSHRGGVICHTFGTQLTLSRIILRVQKTSTFCQIVLFIFVVLCLTPQIYILTRPKSTRYCEKPLFNNLIAVLVFTFMATGLAVTLTLTDPVPKSIRATYHTFGVLSFTEGLCTIILTYSAPQCAKTTPELYLFSLVLSWACILSTVFFVIRGCLWMIHRMCPNWLSDTFL